MSTFNPNKNLQVEIHLNCPSMTQGYTIWHIKGKDKMTAIARNTENFDWMTDRQMTQFNNGIYKFKMTARMALDLFNYLY